MDVKLLLLKGETHNSSIKYKKPFITTMGVKLLPLKGGTHKAPNKASDNKSKKGFNP